MEDIFVEISWKSGTKEEAIARVKAILAAKRWKTGAFEEQGAPEDGPVVGNLEVEEGLYDKVADGAGWFEATDGVATVRFECP